VNQLPPLPLNAWLRWDVVSRLLPESGIRDVLEVGCGQGAVAARLTQRYHYVGLESDDTSCVRARQRFAAARGTGEIRNGDLSLLAADETFDLVCAFEVLEHLEDDNGALAEWVERIRPGGWLLISTPAFNHRMGPFDEIVGHYRRYDPPVMERLLADAGLVDIDVVVYGAPLGYALEAARNLVDRRRLRKASGASMEQRTSGSGRVMQPEEQALGMAFQAASAPFRRIQRAFPTKGTGLVARGRLPG
jgi:SAM-dependent methyltransferase